jgi:hypothetical protein
MAATGGGRLLIRVAGGVSYLRLLAVAGITTVLVTRAYLAMAGYPQLGSGALHIAHVLWGGLLMLAALVAALLFVGGAAHVWAALLGGVGLGLFVDEVGKFVTKSNDYFYRPAAGIVYLVFAGLLVLTSLIRRPPPLDSGARLANAAELAAIGLISCLTAKQRRTAEQLITERDDESSRAVQQLLAAAPVREPSLLQGLVRRPVAVTRWLADRYWFIVIVILLFLASECVVAVVFGVQAMLIASGHPAEPGTETGAILASAVTRTLSAALTIVGIAKWRRDRLAGYRWLRTAALVGLLVTQLFNFTDSQFRAVAELPFNLLVLALVSYHLRQPRQGFPTESVPVPAS